MTVRWSSVVPGVGQPWSLLPHVDGSLISSHLGKRERGTQNLEISKQGGALGSHLVNPFPHPAASTFSPAILKGPAPKRLHCRWKEASSRPQEERVGSGPRPASYLAAPILTAPSSSRPPFRSVTLTGSFRTAEQLNSDYSIKINNVKMS